MASCIWYWLRKANCSLEIILDKNGLMCIEIILEIILYIQLQREMRRYLSKDKGLSSLGMRERKV